MALHNYSTRKRKRKCLLEKEEEDEAPETIAERTVTQPTIKQQLLLRSLLGKYDVRGIAKLSAEDIQLLVDVLEGKKEEEETFLKGTDDSSDEFRKTLLQIVAKNLPEIGVTPGIIAHLGSNIDLLFEQIEDKTFILLALTARIKSELFSGDNCNANASNDNSSKEALFNDFLKIKSRWMILDNIIEAPSNPSSTGMDAFTNRLINRAAHSMKRRLFDGMLNGILKDKGNMVEPLDASFSVSMIDKTNFQKVNSLVKRNLITFFSFVAKSLLNQCHLNSSTITKLKKEEESTSRSLNVFFKRRRVVLRNFTLKNVVRQILETLAHSEGVDDDNNITEQRDVCEMGQSFIALIKRLHESQSYDLIQYWEVPLPVLLQLFNNAVTEMYRRGILMSFDKKLYLTTPPLFWFDKRLRLLVEKIIKKGGFDSIPEKEVDCVIDIMLRVSCSDFFLAIFEKYIEKLTVARIKDMVQYIVTEAGSCYTILEILLNNFPWLLNTWFGYDGNTLLCLCVYYNYKHLDNLLALDIVKKHINVESKNGCNPLFMAADHSEGYNKFHKLWKKGGADLKYVNRHHESVFHRLAASNNSECLRQFENDSSLLETKSILELRRKGDAATALMVALAREHVDAASVLMNLGASAVTYFGQSKTLRTVEAMFLKKKLLSVALLAEAGIEPIISIIAEASNALFEEECFVPMTGIEDNGKHIAYINRNGKVSQRLEQNQKTYARRRRRIEIRKWRQGNGNRSSLCLDDSTWSLFDENSGRSKLKWVTLLLKNNEKKLKQYIKESMKDFKNETCTICFDGFEDQSSNELRKGMTSCGHSFHVACWKDLHVCPTCRKLTSLYFTGMSILEPNTVIQKLPPTKVRQFRRKEETTMKDKKIVVRYEFLIDGKWVDESSPLNKSST